LQFLYVTLKAPPGEAISETRYGSDGGYSNASGETDLNSEQSRDKGQEEVDTTDPYLSHEGEISENPPPSASSFSSSPEESSDFSDPVVGLPMDIQPVPAGTTMPMVPASSGGGMEVTTPADSPDMPIIPATAYPPMEIEPVPDYLQEEMLRNMQP
ncbi:MAG TPA: hypothetical protein DD706_00120, partial [Nitrospiraceae bacterium]|nr:hypothetical protein [Nitrospiraceae bacterium]